MFAATVSKTNSAGNGQHSMVGMRSVYRYQFALPTDSGGNGIEIEDGQGASKSLKRQTSYLSWLQTHSLKSLIHF